MREVPAKHEDWKGGYGRQHPVMLWAAIITGSGALIGAGIALGRLRDQTDVPSPVEPDPRIVSLESDLRRVQDKLDSTEADLQTCRNENSDLQKVNEGLLDKLGDKEERPKPPEPPQQMLPFACQWVAVPYNEAHADGLRIIIPKIMASHLHRGHRVSLRIESPDRNVGLRNYSAGDTMVFEYVGQKYTLKVHTVRLTNQAKRTGQVEISID